MSPCTPTAARRSPDPARRPRRSPTGVVARTARRLQARLGVVVALGCGLALGLAASAHAAAGPEALVPRAGAEAAVPRAGPAGAVPRAGPEAAVPRAGPAGARAPAQVTLRLRLVDSRPLPGHPAAGDALPAGTRWTIGAQRLRGPAPLGCDRLRTAMLALPREGWFQGEWQGSPDEAQALGLTGPVAGTLRLDCDRGSHDLIRSDDGHWLLALDGRVLRWADDSPAADADTPAAATRALLLTHLGAAGGLDASALERLRPHLDESLQAALQAWLEQPTPEDEAPALEGDPFLDAQEPPRQVRLGRTQRAGDRARQTVWLDFEDGQAGDHDPARAAGGAPPARWHSRSVQYEWRREAGRWRLHDIHYGGGTRWRQLLTP